MEKMRLAISLDDGRTIEAEPRPEDAPHFAELTATRSAVQLTGGNSDVEGHAQSTDVALDVEGHAMVLRLPNAGDATALRRALAVGAVTATLVGAGAIAGLQNARPSAVPAEHAPARVQPRAMPAPAMRAQRDQMEREAANENAGRTQTVNTVPLDAQNPAIPARALRADQAEMTREEQLANAMREEKIRGLPVDAENPLVPDQARRAGTE